MIPQHTIAAAVLMKLPDLLPPLQNIIHHPFILFRNGQAQLIMTPGYHWESGHYLDLPEQNIRTDLTIKECLAILDDIYGEFPFQGRSSYANFIGIHNGQYLAEARKPLLLVDKATTQSGASILADGMSHTMLNGEPAKMTPVDGIGENEKILGSVLRQRPNVLIIDNVDHHFNLPTLTSGMTSNFIAVRMLGQNSMIQIPNRLQIIMTGNNPSFRRDLANRSVYVRLDPGIADPETRTHFRHDLQNREHLLSLRPRLLDALTSLATHWINAGAPRRTPAYPLGSYKDFMECVQGMLDLFGIEGFQENRTEFIEKADSFQGDLEGFMLTWLNTYDTTEQKASELSKLLTDPDTGRDNFAWTCNGDSANGRQKSFSDLINSLVGKIYELEIPGQPGAVQTIQVSKTKKGRRRVFKLSRLDARPVEAQANSINGTITELPGQILETNPAPAAPSQNGHEPTQLLPTTGIRNTPE